jgi:TetR/AcrR family transcriptional repressor of nem operon
MKCISSYFDNAMLEIKEKVAQQTSSKQALINIINDKAAWIVDCEKGCLGIKTVFEIAPEDNEVRRVMSQNNEIFLQFLAGVVQKAIDDKELDGSEDATLMAEYIMTSFTGWKQSYILDRNPMRIKKMADYLIKQITR